MWSWRPSLPTVLFPTCSSEGLMDEVWYGPLELSSSQVWIQCSILGNIMQQFWHPLHTWTSPGLLSIVMQGLYRSCIGTVLVVKLQVPVTMIWSWFVWRPALQS